MSWYELSTAAATAADLILFLCAINLLLILLPYLSTRRVLSSLQRVLLECEQEAVLPFAEIMR